MSRTGMDKQRWPAAGAVITTDHGRGKDGCGGWGRRAAGLLLGEAKKRRYRFMQLLQHDC
jgi:hypothetical protein